MSLLLNFTVVEGKDMPAMDLGGKSDLYVVSKLGPNNHKTKVIKKSLQPIWNEKFQLTFNNMNDDVIFEVYDWDLIGKHDSVGKTSIPVSKLQNGKNDLWLTLPPIKNTNPQLHVILELEPSIRLKVCEGKDLPAMDIGGTSDPFVEISFGKEQKKTKTIKKTLNPQWNETFDFHVKDMSAPIFLSVYDWDLLSSKDKMGQVVVTLTSLKAGLNKDLWLPLEKRGALRVEIEAIGFGSTQQNQQQQGSFGQQQQMFGNQNSFGVQQGSFGMQQQQQQQQKPIVLPTIINAVYGVEGLTVDVTTQFMTLYVKLQQNGKLIGFSPSWLCQELGYDPAQGQLKTLTLDFCPPGTLQETRAYFVDNQVYNLF
eukprot:gene6512-10520_t